jgi:hypothetical protein
MASYFSQEDPMTTYFTHKPINATFVFDSHGNTIPLDNSGNMISDNDLEKSVEYELENKGILPPSIFKHRCSICYKVVRTKDFTHYRCRDVVTRLSKAKKNVLDLEFKLFCLRHTNNKPVNLDIYNIE